MKNRNMILIFCVILLSAWPLLTLKRPDGGELFTGADGEAEKMVSAIAPSYTPWARPPMELPGEIESLLFSLQAAAGAGVLGYWYGSARTRRRYEAEGRLTVRGE